jgi:type II secretory pathway pseudopilin PulG
MSTNHLPANRGSTLVEVMIACAVLAVSMVATLAAMTSSQVATNAAKEEALALRLVSKQMNVVRSLSFQEIEAMVGESTLELFPAQGGGKGDGKGNGHAYAYGHLKGRDGVVPIGTRTVTSDSGTLVVEVTVTWSSKALGQELSRSLFWRAAP